MKLFCFLYPFDKSQLEIATGRATRGPGLKIQARGPYGPKRA